MDRIYGIAVKEQYISFLEQYTAELEKLLDKPENNTVRLDRLIAILEKSISEADENAEKGPGWDFSREKAQPLLVTDGVLSIRPMRDYPHIRSKSGRNW